MSVVIDASVTLAWCLEDDETGYSASVLGALSRGKGVAPVIWPLEVANGLLLAERRERIGPEDTARLISFLCELRFRLDSSEAGSVFEDVFPLAKRVGLTSYDASYLELAMRERIALATVDTRLKQACRRLGVAIFEP